MPWSLVAYVFFVLSNPIEFTVMTPYLQITLPVTHTQGCIAALVHHTVITVGLSSDIAYSIVYWTLSNLAYVLLAESTNTLKGLLLFNAIYVVLYSGGCLSIDYLCLHLQSDLQRLFTSSRYSDSIGVQLV